MSYNSRRQSSGPWRERYYPYERHQDQWGASGSSYYDSGYNYNYNYGYGYDDSSYYAPPRSQQYDYYPRDTYEDSGYYHDPRYPTNERQPARYNEREYYHSNQAPRSPKRHSQGHRNREDPYAMSSKFDPAPYAYERDDRPVTPPPPRSPSPTYLKIADESPQKLSSAADERKLLILDLNGTLVHRSAIARTKKGVPVPPPRDSNGRPLPRLRPVHSRPYMAVFRSYLFAPETRAWLDVMVWSSAQPHSVEDMVAKCFESDKEKLLAIWARDTLGLTQDHYHRKVQTVKDLNTPWTKLPSLSHSYDSDASSGDESSRHVQPHRDTIHSALTTLLLDDSPRKAELQPYNHVCISEYSGEMRANDLEVLRIERLLGQNTTDILPEFPDTSAEAPIQADAPLSPAAGEDADSENPRKRKRKEKKEAKRQQATLKAQSERDHKTYDETLLAVIGVLDEIKWQQNVAAWIRSGGLLGPSGRLGGSTGDVLEGVGQPDESFDVPSSSSASASLESPLQRGAARISPNEDTDEKVEGRIAKGGKQPHREGGVRDGIRAQADEVEEPHLDGSQPAGNDVISTLDSHASCESSIKQDKSAIDAVQSMWFEDPQTIRFWIERGKKALGALRIPVEPGIDH